MLAHQRRPHPQPATHPNEGRGTASPQLAAAEAFAAHVGDVTLELADLTIRQLSAVAALLLALHEANARALAAERALANLLHNGSDDTFITAASELVSDASFVEDEGGVLDLLMPECR
jgi:hypothetical protein